ncbi:MAG: hypothetical protein WDN28_17515 [Chthoniobacter sp.]
MKAQEFISRLDEPKIVAEIAAAEQKTSGGNSRPSSRAARRTTLWPGRGNASRNSA